jgi:hypothetical protein
MASCLPLLALFVQNAPTLKSSELPFYPLLALFVQSQCIHLEVE